MVLVSLALTFFTLTLLVRAVFSWIPRPTGALASIGSFAFTVTEPVLAPVRRVLPPVAGIDLSMIVVFIGIYVLRAVLGI